MGVRLARRWWRMLVVSMFIFALDAVFAFAAAFGFVTNIHQALRFRMGRGFLALRLCVPDSIRHYSPLCSVPCQNQPRAARWRLLRLLLHMSSSILRP